MNKKISVIVILTVVILLGAFYFASNKKNKISDVAKDREMVRDQSDQKGYIDIEPKEAYELITNNPMIAIVDVSPRFEKGHLPGSINHYVGDGSLDKAIPNLNKDETYLVYCHVDSASISGAKKLVEAGFPNVYRLKGNYSAWIEGGYPIEVEIKAVGKYSGNALATRSYLDGKFIHNVVANIADPTSGKFYEGWLVKGTSFFSTGKMEKINGQYALKYESDKDSRNYKKIVITEETEAQGLDGKPEAHVLEGEFE